MRCAEREGYRIVETSTGLFGICTVMTESSIVAREEVMGFLRANSKTLVTMNLL